MKIIGRKKCLKCGKTVIQITEQIDTGTEYKYESRNTEDRYIDRWGFERDFCKNCMR